MPVYRIKCKTCLTEEDIHMTWEEKEELIKKECPKCGQKTRFNKIHNIGIQLSNSFRRGL